MDSVFKKHINNAKLLFNQGKKQAQPVNNMTFGTLPDGSWFEPQRICSNARHLTPALQASL